MPPVVVVKFAQEWMGDNFPRMVAITFEIPSPYFVESYSLNSANNGPWGDAVDWFDAP